MLRVQLMPARCVILIALLLSAFVLPVALGAAPPSADPEVRRRLTRALLSEGEEQRELVRALADSGSEFAGDVLSAWVKDGVYLFESPDGSKWPVLLEEQADLSSATRLFRIET